MSKFAARRRRRGMTLLEMLIVLVIMVALGTMMIPSLSWMGQNSQRMSTIENLARLREIIVNKYYVDMGELPRPRAALTGSGSGSGSGTGTRLNHPQLVYLFVNPDTHEDSDPNNDLLTPGNALSGRRWQGPYIMHAGSEYYVTDSDTSLTTGTNFTASYGNGDATTRIGDPTPIDAWGQPVVIQEPATDIDGNGTITPAERKQFTRLVSAGRNGVLETPDDVPMPTKAQRGDDLLLFLFRHDENGDLNLELDQ